jgi:aspartyl-tRNA(Asn)/glutamyl-tRNA(Gln) amidotransferase subunit B
VSWETVIGIEVHVQLRTATKMFCRCSSEYGARPNTNVCPVCLGLPGALPMPNQGAVDLAIRAALALGCQVHERSEFVRKNYFYPDLPKGYQITQFAHPLATEGTVVMREGGEERHVRVRRLHLEEDAGKSMHDRYAASTAVDLNRAGVPLVEIVTEPDLRSPAEARAYLSRLKQLLEHFAAVSDCNMEEGSLRVDANLSVRRLGETQLGTKTEVKNLNSFSNVEKALAFERERQIGRLERGDEVASETRLFDLSAGETRPLRGKEEDFDYRYFPEPDLVPLEVDSTAVDTARDTLGELPHELERRLMDRYELSEYDAMLVSVRPSRAAYFEAVTGGRDAAFAKTTANFLMGGIAAELNRRPAAAPERDLLPADRLTRLVELRLDGTLSSDTASQTLELLLAGEGEDVDEVVRTHGLAQVSDVDQLSGWVDAVLHAHPDELARYADGEDKLFGFFMGALMRSAGGKADPKKAKALLAERLAAARD